MKKTITFTKEGYENLKKELLDLQTNLRPKAVERLARARAQGDLRENSEYSAAKEDLSFAEGRIREIDELLKRAEIVETVASNIVSIGAEVLVDRNGKEEKYQIVGEFEADPSQRKLSATSPIGKALIGKKTGDLIAIEVPAGTINYKILKIIK
jgi:transcription elongation factor GreA